MGFIPNSGSHGLIFNFNRNETMAGRSRFSSPLFKFEFKLPCNREELRLGRAVTLAFLKTLLIPLHHDKVSEALGALGYPSLPTTTVPSRRA